MAKKIIDDATRASKASFTHVEFILDETGSMQTCWQSTIDGFNEYVNGLKQDKENKYRLSLVKFDANGIKTVYTDMDIHKVPDLNMESYVPGSMTNLNDAIGVTMTNLEARLKDEDCNIIVIVLTDGEENASREWSQKAVADLVERKKNDGWTITFLGANIDTQRVGRAYAMDAGNIKAYSTSNMGGTMRGLTEATVMCASNAVMGSATADFFAGTDDWTEGDDNRIDANDSVVSNGLNSLSRSAALNLNGLNMTGSTTWNVDSSDDNDSEEDDSDE